ncbi:MAG: hypothetical protein K0R55_4296 [Sporomusa sp.]|nr:hypothetical protein [Sporomusa sp.]
MRRDLANPTTFNKKELSVLEATLLRNTNWSNLVDKTIQYIQIMLLLKQTFV